MSVVAKNGFFSPQVKRTFYGIPSIISHTILATCTTLDSISN
ncbi:hypothetical protein TcasGA2_TC033164 [Tribolium castaneum]|nr:hypothetical protein TcasGA2_TC033164 [Tribolium castaneum]